jgi:hypothetical protein
MGQRRVRTSGAPREPQASGLAVADFSTDLGLDPEVLRREGEALLAYAEDWLTPSDEPFSRVDDVRVEVIGSDNEPHEPVWPIDVRELDPQFGISDLDRQVLAAGCTVLAAVDRLLVDQVGASSLFRQVAATYRETRNSFFFTCAILAGRVRGYDWGLIRERGAEPHHTLLALALAFRMGLPDELSLPALLSRWIAEWEPYFQAPVGDAGIPLGAYAQALLPLLPSESQSRAEPRASDLWPLSAAVEQRLGVMRQVEDRWRELAWDAPLIDPDALAACTIAIQISSSTMLGEFRDSPTILGRIALALAETLGTDELGL